MTDDVFPLEPPHPLAAGTDLSKSHSLLLYGGGMIGRWFDVELTTTRSGQEPVKHTEPQLDVFGDGTVTLRLSPDPHIEWWFAHDGISTEGFPVPLTEWPVLIPPRSLADEFASRAGPDGPAYTLPRQPNCAGASRIMNPVEKRLLKPRAPTRGTVRRAPSRFPPYVRLAGPGRRRNCPMATYPSPALPIFQRRSENCPVRLDATAESEMDVKLDKPFRPGEADILEIALSADSGEKYLWMIPSHKIRATFADDKEFTDRSYAVSAGKTGFHRSGFGLRLAGVSETATQEIDPRSMWRRRIR